MTALHIAPEDHAARPETAADALLLAVIDRIIPRDKDPGALDLGTERYVKGQLEGDARAQAGILREGLAALEREARHRHGSGFAALAAAPQDVLLAEAERSPWFLLLSELCAEGFYADPANGGNKDARSWAMIGYEHRLPEGPNGPMAPIEAPPPRRQGRVQDGYDVIVVGAGAAGGVMAAVLAEAGKRVLVLERGPHLSYATHGRRDHLRNQRLAEYGHNAGPDIEGNPRVLIGADGNERILRPHEHGYQNNAAAVGSGTVVYGAQAWRFLPDDFRMASRYGVPRDSSLVDWPIGYDELAPFYEQAEWEIGVAGQSERNPHKAVRGKPYPMPPTAQHRSAAVLKRGAGALGIDTLVPPLLINTVPRDGRPACIACGSCVGFACPSNGKNGTHNTMLPRALQTGHCELIAGAMVERVDTDEHGKVVGVTFVEDTESGRSRRSVLAKTVVLSAGAIETARLLLLSRSPLHPDGLGNTHDQVGRHLQGHCYAAAWGEFDEEVYDPRGPGVTIATLDYNHGNDGIIGGAMLADDFILLPAIFWKTARPADAPRWGVGAKDFMRRFYRRITAVKGPVHEIPDPTCRVELDPNLRDRYGLPVARLSGVVHPETLKAVAYMNARAADWLRAAGASRVWSYDPVPRLSAGQHQAGTCRMGSDPKTSVTDPWGRVWGHDNLFVSDGSLHPTNGGFNPVLTIMALAFRNAAHIAAEL
jgi:choline dehydrogenase-like flavoprotein